MINLSLDTNKISKDRIKKHANGSNYLNITVDKLKEVGKYGETHCVYETQTKEERAAKAKRNYIGNGKEITFGGNNSSANTQQPAQNFTPSPDEIDSLPF